MIPNSVTKIDCRFANCSGLTSVTIPYSVTEIGWGAFDNCSKLKSVYYNTNYPIIAPTSIFNDYDYRNTRLYVPKAAIERCWTREPWRQFRYIIPYDFSCIIEDISIDFYVDAPCEIYNLNGVKAGNSLEGLAPGIYIVRQGNTIKKISVK